MLLRNICHSKCTLDNEQTLFKSAQKKRREFIAYNASWLNYGGRGSRVFKSNYPLYNALLVLYFGARLMNKIKQSKKFHKILFESHISSKYIDCYDSKTFLMYLFLSLSATSHFNLQVRLSFLMLHICVDHTSGSISILVQNNTKKVIPPLCLTKLGSKGRNWYFLVESWYQ